MNRNLKFHATWAIHIVIIFLHCHLFAATLQEQLKKNPENLSLREKLARSLYKKKKFNQVSKTLEPYVDDLNIKSLKLLSNSYHELKDYKNEERVLKLILEQRPKSAKVLYAMALAQRKQKNMDGAVTNLRKSIKSNPQFKHAYVALSKIFEAQKNYYEARNTIKDIIRLFGDKPQYQTSLCRYFAVDGYLEETLSHCQIAAKKDPKVPENHIFLAQSLLDKGDKKQGQKILKQTVQRFPKSEPALSALGLFYLKKDNFASALRFYKRAVAAQKNSARAHIGLAQASFGNKNYELALKSFKKSCRLDEHREYDVLQKFRKATGQLRQKSIYRWMSKYSSGLYACRGSSKQ